MIEFKKYGDYDSDSGSDSDGDAILENEENERGLLLGVGQAGIGVLDQLVMHGREGFEVLALDTDQSAVEGSVSPEKRLLAQGLCRGLGTFGCAERGRSVWKAESLVLLERLQGIRHLVLTVGLGGGTGTVLAVEIVKAVRRQSEQGGRKSQTHIAVVCALPSAFEPEARRKEARRALAELRAHADAVLAFSNDRADAWTEARENIRHGLHALNLELSSAAATAARIMAAGGMNPISFADLRSLFGCLGDQEVHENAWIGCGQAHVDEDPGVLVQRALASPLLADEAAWHQADGCLACVVGGHDFSIGQMKSVTKALQLRFPRTMPVLVGARNIDRHEGRLELTLLFAQARRAACAQPEIHLPITVAPPVAKPAAATPARPKVRYEPDAVPVEAEVAEEVAEPKAKPVPVPVAPLRKAKPAPAPATTLKLKPVVQVEAAEVAESAEVFAQALPAAVVVEELIPEMEMMSARPATEGKSRSRLKPVKQEELPFDAGTRGRFDNSFETIHKGENLDQPTFRRRRIAIKA